MTDYSLASVRKTVSQCRAKNPVVCPYHGQYMMMERAIETGDAIGYLDARERVEEAERERAQTALRPVSEDGYGAFTAQTIMAQLHASLEDMKHLIAASTKPSWHYDFRTLDSTRYRVEVTAPGEAAMVYPTGEFYNGHMDDTLFLVNKHLIHGAESVRGPDAGTPAEVPASVSSTLYTLVDSLEAEDTQDWENPITEQDRQDAFAYLNHPVTPVPENVQNLFHDFIDMSYDNADDDDYDSYTSEDLDAAGAWLKEATK